jgi:hypothetical protein
VRRKEKKFHCGESNPTLLAAAIQMELSLFCNFHCGKYLVRYAPGCAIGQAVSRRLPTAGFVVDKEALWQVFFEYFGFPCQEFRLLLQTRHEPSSSGAGTIGQIMTDVPIGFGSIPTPPPPPKKSFAPN